jgi:hypothetical protein
VLIAILDPLGVRRLEGSGGAAVSRQALGAIAGLAVLLEATGCSQRLVVIDETADRLELRWYNWDANLNDAARLADTRCAQRGQHADLGQEMLDEDVTLAEFVCR